MLIPKSQTDPPYFLFRPWTAKMDVLAIPSGWIGAGGRRRQAVQIGNDLTKIDFLLINAVLVFFWPFLALLDVRNGSDSKFRVYGWYREVCTTKISPFRGKSVIQPHHRPFCIFFLACVKKCKTLINQPPPPTYPFDKH